jgi:hypothetical protein
MPWVQDLMVASLVEAFCQSAKGAAHEGNLIVARHWGFEFEDIAMRVHLWHGNRDNQVRTPEAKTSARRLPHCDAVFYQDDAHISTIVKHGDEIVRTLAN